MEPKLRQAFLTLLTFTLSVSALQAQINYSTANYCSATYTYTTNATAYAPSGAGNCGYPAGTYNPNLSAAINSNAGNGGDDYQNGLVCGACAAVFDTATSAAITVTIVDSCPSCANGANQLDLTQATWTALTGNTAYGVLPIQWKFVPCPLSLMPGDASGNISYEWKQCNNNGYTPIQFLDTLFPITAVSFSTSSGGPFTSLVLGANGVGGNSYWGTPSGNLNGTGGPFYFDVTDGRGGSVTLGPISNTNCSIAAATAQFPGCGPTATPTKTNTPGGPTDTPTTVPTKTPTPGSGCVYNLNSGAACTFVQSATVDNCTAQGAVGAAASTMAINQFYTYGGTGVSVLYCGGSTAGGNASPQVITMQCVPPANATIIKTFVDIVEFNGGSSSPTYTAGPIVVGGQTTGAGFISGYGNLWNKFIDPRYGADVTSYPNQTAWNVRYDATAQFNTPASLSSLTHTVTYPNIGANTAWSASMVIVYTVPAPNICSAVVLDDGLYYWDLEHDNAGSPLNEGVTPYAPTLDWGCSLDTSTTCATNNFSVFGGSQYGLNNPPSVPQFTDDFYGTPSGVPAVSSTIASEW
ncbi:MAG TPA: expansin-like protein, partial [bacterium]